MANDTINIISSYPYPPSGGSLGLLSSLSLSEVSLGLLSSLSYDYFINGECQLRINIDSIAEANWLLSNVLCQLPQTFDSLKNLLFSSIKWLRAAYGHVILLVEVSRHSYIYPYNLSSFCSLIK